MLTVIAGGMFSEKSTELQRRGRRLERAGKKVIYFKPDFDNRYSLNELVTHDGSKVPALNLPVNLPEVIYGEIEKDTDAVLIDEIQFFNDSIIQVIQDLLKDGITVIVAGLDLDFEAKPFILTACLMAMAEQVVKLQAVCSECGHDSWVSFKEPNGQRIQLGTDEYKPLCRKCFNKKQGVSDNE